MSECHLVGDMMSWVIGPRPYILLDHKCKFDVIQVKYEVTARFVLTTSFDVDGVSISSHRPSAHGFDGAILLGPPVTVLQPLMCSIIYEISSR